MDKVTTIRRITKNAIYLPLGDNLKVSLQLLVVFIIGLTSSSFIDALIVTSLYLGLGMFLPIYAGFNAGITPTFGFVISFVVVTIPLYFLNKLKIKNQFIRMGLACFVALIICYAIGGVFLSLYTGLSIEKALLVGVVPYIPFDIVP